MLHHAKPAYAAAGAAPPTGNIVSDAFTDDPRLPLMDGGRVVQTVEVGDTPAVWEAHSGNNSSRNLWMFGDGTLGDAGFVQDPTAGTIVFYMQDIGTITDLVIESTLKSHTVTNWPAIALCVDPSNWMNHYTIYNGGSGGGGFRLGRNDGGTGTSDLITMQGVTGGRVRLELSYTTWVAKLWSNWLVSQAETPPWFGTTTLTDQKVGRRVGVWGTTSTVSKKFIGGLRFGEGF